MNKAFDKIIEKLEEELKLADEGKLLCARENPLQFDSAKGYANGVANAIEIVKQEAEQYNNGWISVKERLPEKAGSYLVIGKSGGAIVTRWYKPSEFHPNGHFGGNCSDYIRYWMPRPEPPRPYQPKGE